MRRARGIAGRRPRRLGALALALAGALAPGALAPGAEEAAAERAPRAGGAGERCDLPRRLAASSLEPCAARAALARARRLPRLRSLLVAVDGETVIAERLRGPRLNVPVNVKSVSKSIISVLVGVAIAEGALSGVNQPIGAFFAEALADDAERAEKSAITVEDLLTMRSGLVRTSGGSYADWVASEDWVAYALAPPLETTPGTAMEYSTGNSHLLSAILTQATGRSTHAFARAALAEPLGITLPRWRRDPQGVYFGGNQMFLSPRALLAFGELMRRGGVTREGRQIVPAAWVRASTTARTRSPYSGERYGYGWFVSRAAGHPMFFAWGYGGQHVFVIPPLAMTVVMTSEVRGGRKLEHLIGIRALVELLAIAGRR